MIDKPTAAIGHMPFEGHRSCAHLVPKRDWPKIPSWSGGTRYAVPAPRPIAPATRAMRRRYKALRWLEGLNDWTPYSSPWTIAGPLSSARGNGLCETRDRMFNGYRIGVNWRITDLGTKWLRSFEALHPDFGTINLNPHVQQA